MALRAAVEDVLSLQAYYSSSNTDEMRWRGEIVRRDIPSLLALRRAELAAAARIPEPELLIEGRDGTGLKSEVPWVRIASKERSPRATAGWYVVLLHRRDGAGVYLALAHGSTTFVGGSLIPRSDEELTRLVSWGRRELETSLRELPGLVEQIRLAANAPLAAAYEKSTLAAFYYRAGELPSDEKVLGDVITLVSLLGQLYEAERLGRTPLSVSPEVLDAATAAGNITRPTSGGQGFQLTAAERRAVEMRAMALAEAWLTSEGYSVKDMSRTCSYDLLATRDDSQLVVEVKGTTGLPSSVLLTKNEVALHLQSFPENALIVAHGINLENAKSGPIASGGDLMVVAPWRVDESRLTPIAYAYKLDD